MKWSHLPGLGDDLILAEENIVIAAVRRVHPDVYRIILKDTSLEIRGPSATLDRATVIAELINQGVI